ncbi:hypothetical protein ACT3CD_10425 [Geofilum sp. OHC36d9]|uniref:hypothetical protein n=1 Tax=Geofilum sp. OHC36d9 TaxID=3458413 RepID=UPI0040338A43
MNKKAIKCIVLGLVQIVFYIGLTYVSRILFPELNRCTLYLYSYGIIFGIFYLILNFISEYSNIKNTIILSNILGIFLLLVIYFDRGLNLNVQIGLVIIGSIPIILTYLYRTFAAVNEK